MVQFVVLKSIAFQKGSTQNDKVYWIPDCVTGGKKKKKDKNETEGSVGPL